MCLVRVSEKTSICSDTPSSSATRSAGVCRADGHLAREPDHLQLGRSGVCRGNLPSGGAARLVAGGGAIGERAQQPDGASDGADAADATSVQVGDAAKTAASASTGQASDSGDQVSESPTSATTTVFAYNPDAPASEVSQGVTLKLYTDKNHTESFDPAQDMIEVGDGFLHLQEEAHRARAPGGRVLLRTNRPRWGSDAPGCRGRRADRSKRCGRHGLLRCDCLRAPRHLHLRGARGGGLAQRGYLRRRVVRCGCDRGRQP